MELGLDIAGDERVDVIVSSDSRSGADLGGKEGAEWRRSCDPPSKLDSLPHQRNVGRVRQASRIKGRGVKGVIGGDI